MRTARLTVLIDPRKKAVFERLCASEDLTPSQVMRRLIRAYIEKRMGSPWAPADKPGRRRGGTPGCFSPIKSEIRRQQVVSQDET